MKFHVMDHTGHTTVEFKPEEIDAAMAKFQALIDDGKVAGFRKAGETDYTAGKVFDPTADEVVFRRQLVGG